MEKWSLLPCPFCGGRPELKIFPHPSNKLYNKVEIKCTNCLAQGRTFMDGERMTGGKVEISEAIEAAVSFWNRREGGDQLNAQIRKALTKAFCLIDRAKEILEEIREDEQEAYDTLPGVLQSRERGEEMDGYIHLLDEAYKHLNDAGSIIDRI